MKGKPLRIGLLGAARIAPAALINPARAVEGVSVVALAARDKQRADAFAAKHGIPVVFSSYDELLASGDIDAIYNPLPNGLHCEWTEKALAAGKHVLCEKPLSANAAQARQMVAAAAAQDRILMTAYHYQFHALATVMRDSVAQLGKLERIECSMCFPLPLFGDIRYRYDLAGGATMDVGAYTAHMLLMLARCSGNEGLQLLPDIQSAQAKTLRRDPRIDRAMDVEVSWPCGTTGRIENSMWSSRVLKMSVRVRGERGELKVTNPIIPQLYHRYRVTIDGARRSGKAGGEGSYTAQLREFQRRIHERDAANGDNALAVDAMQLIDNIYTAAGMPLRE